MHLRNVLWTALASLFLCGAVSAQTLTALSVNTGNNQFSLNDLSLTTGSASNTRTSGQTGFMSGLAYRPQDGFLYGLTQNISTNFTNQLVRLNPTTGVATAIGPHGMSTYIEGGMAVDPTTGTLYCAYNLGATNFEFFTLNITTGAATFVGNLTGMTEADSGNDPSGLAFDASGQMFLLDDFSGTAISPNAALYRVNKATGAVTATVNLDRQLSGALGLAINPNTGVFYVGDSNFSGGFAGTNSLYTLNPNTGATMLVGGTGLPNLLTDMTFLPAAVPEPTTFALVGLGLLSAGGLAWWRTGRKASNADAGPDLIEKD